MQKLIGYFSPTLEQVIGLGAVILVCFGLALVGSAMGGQKRLRELDIVSGWSLVSLFFVLGGGWVRLDFRLITGALALVLIVSVYVNTKRGFPQLSVGLSRTILLALPMVWLAACMTLSQWDDFTHWMPNAQYLFAFHTLPGEGNPPSASVFPGYPHGITYIVYLSSQIAGHLAENATPVFNMFLLASLAVLVGRMVRTAIKDETVSDGAGTKSSIIDNLGWGYCALGALAVTALNPTFVPKIVFTSYADTPTAVLVGILCIVMWHILSNLAGDDDRYSPNSLAWSYGLVAMAMVSVKQPNVVLFGLITIGGLLVALRDPKIQIYKLIRLLPAMVIPPITIYLLWRLHISTNNVGGEFSFHPPALWLTDQISAIVSRMALIATKKGGYFSIMLIACLLAVPALWRVRTPIDRLCIIVAVLFVGYNAFLLLVFVTAYGGQGLVAPSYWRFNMHLGGACVAFGAYGVALIWRRWLAHRVRPRYAWILILLIIVTPFALAYKIRFDQYAPKIFVRAVADEIVETIPKDKRFIAFDNVGIGDLEVIVRYVVKPHVKSYKFVISSYRPTVESLGELISDQQPDYAWVHVPTKTLELVTGLMLPPRHSYLIQRDARRWRIVKSWPFPGYADPSTAPK